MSFGVAKALLIIAAAAAASGTVWAGSAAEGPLRQEAYVWQRDWNPPLREALREHASKFSGLTILQAEVSWKGTEPHVIRVPLDYGALTNLKCPIGLALRIGPYRGSFSTNGPDARFLGALARSLLAEATDRHVVPQELQIDFDCAESKLDGYRLWVVALRRTIGSVPLTITALPSWLGQPAFARLAAATDGFVLQVHSLERPRDYEAPFILCDPAVARRSVERAARLGVAFRVALPTYGYVIAFDQQGRFIGLSAEGPERSWPAGARIREVRADPMGMAELVQFWSTHRPDSLRGLIWYRFPVASDTLNWRWRTLDAIMTQHTLREKVRADVHRVEPGLVEISLVNEGELDISSRLAAEVRWSREGGTRLLAADGLRGFAVVDQGPSTLEFQMQSQSGRLPAGERQVIGWLRLSEDREVQVEIKEF